jgi:hypothetical protein
VLQFSLPAWIRTFEKCYLAVKLKTLQATLVSAVKLLSRLWWGGRQATSANATSQARRGRYQGTARMSNPGAGRNYSGPYQVYPGQRRSVTFNLPHRVDELSSVTEQGPSEAGPSNEPRRPISERVRILGARDVYLENSTADMILDSGASSHVTSCSDNLEGLRAARNGHVIVDAANGQSQVERIGTMVQDFGGREHRLNGVLVCGNIKDTLDWRL